MRKIKIDLVAVPLSGHLFPLLELVRPLLDHPEYQLRLFTGPQKAAFARSLGFEVETFLNSPDEVERFETIANPRKANNLFGTYKQLHESSRFVHDLKPFFREKWQKERPDLVICDFITLSGGLVCQEMGIPWMTSMATQFALDTKSGPPCFFGGLSSDKDSFSKLRNDFLRAINRGSKKVFFKRHKTYLAPLDAAYDAAGFETLYSPYSILGLGMKELELKGGFPDHYHFAGPCPASFEKDLLPDLVLPSDKKKVLISCGTQLPWGKNHLIEIAKDLAQAFPDCHFLLTLGDKEGLEHEDLAENLQVLSYLPYDAYIPQMDYMIHHGGAGVFYHSIKYGKPALILPFAYDQADYAQRGQEKGVALRVDKANPAKIRRAFETLLAKDWSELEQIQKAYQSYHPSQVLENEIKRLLDL